MDESEKVNVTLTADVVTSNGQPFMRGKLEYFNVGRERLVALEQSQLKAFSDLTNEEAENLKVAKDVRPVK